MRSSTSLMLAALSLPLLAACGGGGGGTPPEDVVLDPSYYTDKYAYGAGGDTLGRGINLGNYFDAQGGETAWSGRKLERADLQLIAQAGFKNVRIPVRWADNAGDAEPYALDPVFLARVQEVVGWALEEHLYVVLDVHHYLDLFDAKLTATQHAAHVARLHGIWARLCEAFDTTTYPVDRVVFELLNEPNGAVTIEEWNGIVDDLTQLVWAAQPARKLMIGTANWGSSGTLPALRLPAACTPANTIVTFHWYEPFHFTHQGADWAEGSKAWIGTPWRGTAEDQAYLLDQVQNGGLDAIVAWNAQPGRGFELYLGEFGAYGAYARMDYRKAWTAFLAREVEKRGMSWGYWEFDQGFGAYDRAGGQWHPELLDALVPAENRP